MGFDFPWPADSCPWSPQLEEALFPSARAGAGLAAPGGQCIAAHGPQTPLKSKQALRELKSRLKWSDLKTRAIEQLREMICGMKDVALKEEEAT